MTPGQILVFLLLVAILSAAGIGTLLYIAGMAMRERNQDKYMTKVRQVKMKQAG